MAAVALNVPVQIVQDGLLRFRVQAWASRQAYTILAGQTTVLKVRDTDTAKLLLQGGGQWVEQMMWALAGNESTSTAWVGGGISDAQIDTALKSAWPVIVPQPAV